MRFWRPKTNLFLGEWRWILYNGSSFPQECHAMCHTAAVVPGGRAVRPSPGFTLIELMITVAILGILVALLTFGIARLIRWDDGGAGDHRTRVHAVGPRDGRKGWVRG